MINILNESHIPVLSQSTVSEPVNEVVIAIEEQTGRLEIPKSAQPIKIDKRYVFALGLVHCFALLAFIPWFFS